MSWEIITSNQSKNKEKIFFSYQSVLFHQINRLCHDVKKLVFIFFGYLEGAARSYLWEL